MRLHLNQNGYAGERVHPSRLLADISAEAVPRGWLVGNLIDNAKYPLLHLTRPASDKSRPRIRVYLSTGIHGDEPGGPLAALELIKQNKWPAHAEVILFPCLNPDGLAAGTREGPDEIDLNRDYRAPKTELIRTQLRFLEDQPDFNVALLLHEDWEADGFYFYELSREPRLELSAHVIKEVAKICPILQASSADNWPVSGGVVRPNVDSATRPEWPEAIYFLEKKTDLALTFEAPSDYEMETRISALVTAVDSVIEQF